MIRSLFGLGALLCAVLSAGCGMTVKTKRVGEREYPPNPASDLRFFAAPFEDMEPLVLIEIEGANFDKFQEVRSRAAAEAAKHGADSLLVLREIRQDGSFWHLARTDVSKIGGTVWETKTYEKISASYPVCIYLGVRLKK